MPRPQISEVSEADKTAIYQPLARFYYLHGVLSSSTMHLSQTQDSEFDYLRNARVLRGEEPSLNDEYVNVHGNKHADIIQGTLGERFFSERAVDQWHKGKLSGAKFEQIKIVTNNENNFKFFRLIVTGRAPYAVNVSPHLKDKAWHYLWDMNEWDRSDVFTVGLSMTVWISPKARKALRGLRGSYTEVRIVGLPADRSRFPVGEKEKIEREVSGQRAEESRIKEALSAPWR